MAIDRITSVGAMNISTAPRQTKVADVPEVSVAPVSDTVRQDKVAPVTSQGKENSSQYPGDDKSEVLKEQEVSPGKVKSAVDDLNNQLRSTRCSFKYHEETNRISITVIDKETDEVIKEIPPEKTLDMIAKAWELAGLMVDERR